MNNERIKILEMLQEGKINVEEAMALLKQFPEEGQQEYHYDYTHNESGEQEMDPRQVNPNKPRPPKPPAGADGIAGFARDIAGWAKDLVNEINIDVNVEIDDLDPGSFVGAFFGGKGTPFSFKTGDLQSINSIKLLAKNSSIKIYESDGDYLEIKGQYKPKQPDGQIHFDQTNGDYQLLYDYDAMHHVQISCFVPHVPVNTIAAETKNSSITVDDVNNVQNMILSTKNSSINIDDCSDIGIIEASSRNGTIDLDDVQADDLILTTSNSKIDLDEVIAGKATLTTSNARVSIDDSDIAELVIHTSNAGISLKDIAAGEWQGERYIQAHTSNGGIYVEVPEDIGLEINAQTSRFSNIDCELGNNMILNSMSKNQLSCKSHEYDSFAQQMRLHLATTNATIKIREE